MLKPFMFVQAFKLCEFSIHFYVGGDFAVTLPSLPHVNLREKENNPSFFTSLISCQGRSGLFLAGSMTVCLWASWMQTKFADPTA